MAKQQPELGIKSPFRLRLGLNIDRFRGVNREADPGAIRDDEFQDAVNVRISPSGKIGPRGGQSRVNTSAMTGCIEGLVDDEEDNDLAQLYIGYNEDVATFTELQSPTVQVVGSADLGLPRGAFERRAYYTATSGGDTLLKSIRATPGGGVATPTLEATVAGTVIGAGGVGLEYDGALYIEASSSGLGELWKWDGATFAIEDTSSVSSIPTVQSRVVLHNGALMYLCGGGAVNTEVRQRVSGTWSTLVNDANYLSPSLLTSAYGTLYCVALPAAGGSIDVCQIASTGLTTLRAITVVAPVQQAIYDTIVFNGRFYYLIGYFDGVSTYTYRLGLFNGSTWNDTYSVSPFPFTRNSLLFGWARLFSFEGKLHAIIQAAAGDGHSASIHTDIYVASATDPTSWSYVATSAVSDINSAAPVVA